MLTVDNGLRVDAIDEATFVIVDGGDNKLGSFQSFVAHHTLYATDFAVDTEDVRFVEGLVAWACEIAPLVDACGFVCLMPAGTCADVERRLRDVGACDLSYAREWHSLEIDLAAIPDGRSVIAGTCLPRALEELEGLDPQVTLYLIPHQDDELYTMGSDIIRRSLVSPTIVVLLTDGARCDARDLIHDGGSCDELGDHHVYELSIEEFVAARDNEFLASCAALGVPRENVHVASRRMPDLGVEVEDVKDELERILHAHPLACVCAHAPRFEVSQDPDVRPDLSVAPHRDHCLVGQAVESLRLQGQVSCVRYFVEFYDLSRFLQENPDIVMMKRPLDADQRERFVRALGAYKVWDPESGRYAVGWHSGREMYEGALESSTAYLYDPSRPVLAGATARELVDHVAVLREAFVRERANARNAEARAAHMHASSEDATRRAEEMGERLAAVEGSVSFRAGRLLTAPFRCIRKVLIHR